MVSDNQPYREGFTVCVLFLHRQIFGETILWSEDTPSKEEYASQLKVRYIHFLFMKSNLAVL